MGAVKAMSRFDGDTRVTILNITRRNGVAGHVLMLANVKHEYSDGTDELNTWQVTGSTYGGPVVAHTLGLQTFVTDHERFGSFSDNPREWMRRFVLNEL